MNTQDHYNALFGDGLKNAKAAEEDSGQPPPNGRYLFQVEACRGQSFQPDGGGDPSLSLGWQLRIVGGQKKAVGRKVFPKLYVTPYAPPGGSATEEAIETVRSQFAQIHRAMKGDVPAHPTKSGEKLTEDDLSIWGKLFDGKFIVARYFSTKREGGHNDRLDWGSFWLPTSEPSKYKGLTALQRAKADCEKAGEQWVQAEV